LRDQAIVKDSIQSVIEVGIDAGIVSIDRRRSGGGPEVLDDQFPGYKVWLESRAGLLLLMLVRA
jgi:hypothetical protein